MILPPNLNARLHAPMAERLHPPFATGGGPAAVQHPVMSWVHTILGNVKRSLHGSYHHLSSKHFLRYLAEFSYRFNRRCSLREMFRRLAYVVL